MEIKSYNVGQKNLDSAIEFVSQAFKYPDRARVDRDFPLFFAPDNADHLWVARENNTEEGKILSHAGSFFTHLYIDGIRVPVGGIGGVSTLPEAQGKGCARRLVQQCEDDLSAQGAALAFLWSGEHEFFRQQGYELVGRQWSIPVTRERINILQQAAAERTAQQQQELADIELSTDRKLVQQQGLALQQQYPLRVDRSKDQHQTLLASEGANVYSAKRNGELLAYLVVGKGVDLPGHVHEWAGNEAALLLLLAHALEAENSDLVVLAPQFTPEEAHFIYTLEDLGLQTQPGYMALVKILDYRAVRSLVVERAHALAMEASFMRAEKMEDGTFCVGWATDPDHRLTEHELSRVLFGPDPPSSQLTLSTTAKNALDTLLPLRLWWWGMDSV